MVQRIVELCRQHVWCFGRQFVAIHAMRDEAGSRKRPKQAIQLVALVAYIVLGTIAIKRGKTLAVRATALVAALLVYAYIIMVAVSRQPWPL